MVQPYPTQSPVCGSSDRGASRAAFSRLHLLRPPARLRLQAIETPKGAHNSSALQNNELRRSEQGAPPADISESRPHYHFSGLRFSCSPVSPALVRIHGPSAIHLAPPPYFVAALRGAAPSVRSGDNSTEPTSLPNSLTGRSRPEAVLRQCPLSGIETAMLPFAVKVSPERGHCTGFSSP